VSADWPQNRQKLAVKRAGVLLLGRADARKGGMLEVVPRKKRQISHEWCHPEERSLRIPFSPSPWTGLTP
jgi:hypothetical protein